MMNFSNVTEKPQQKFLPEHHAEQQKLFSCSDYPSLGAKSGTNEKKKATNVAEVVREPQANNPLKILSFDRSLSCLRAHVYARRSANKQQKK